MIEQYCISPHSVHPNLMRPFATGRRRSEDAQNASLKGLFQDARISSLVCPVSVVQTFSLLLTKKPASYIDTWFITAILKTDKSMPSENQHQLLGCVSGMKASCVTSSIFRPQMRSNIAYIAAVSLPLILSIRTPLPQLCTLAERRLEGRKSPIVFLSCHR